MNKSETRQRRMRFFQKFLAMESAGGILLMVAAIFAMMIANSDLGAQYQQLLKMKLTLGFGGVWSLTHSFLHWINDGLMVIFFLLVGMEIKREFMEGELSSRQQAILPLVAAIGGVVTPAIIFTLFNQGHAEAMRGWAIPAATDIAFAVGVLALFGSRVPMSLKVFLTAVAVIDDLMAIVIIALFYTDSLSVNALGIALVCMMLLTVLNLMGVVRLYIYAMVGVVLWLAVLKSGIHATIAGVLLGLAIPLKPAKAEGISPLKSFITHLHGWVVYGILPLFAFANAGIDVQGLRLEQLGDPVPIGIAAGLFFGKQIGIFSTAWLVIRIGLARKPAHASWAQLYGVCIVCGIGFTMSLFVGNLAYTDPLLLLETKLGVMLGSLLSGMVGYMFLRMVLPPVKHEASSQSGA